ncbi:MAG: DUF4907 domain-containing protein [Bacteroidia bacterium]
MVFPRHLIVFFVTFLLLVSCGDDSGTASDSLRLNERLENVNYPDSALAQDITFKTFIVKDSLDKEKGWGYDLYVDGKRTIHQPLIPAVPGNDAFATEKDAKITGELAVQKMKLTGSFPTISIHDLDSLGIKHQ